VKGASLRQHFLARWILEVWDHKTQGLVLQPTWPSDRVSGPALTAPGSAGKRVLFDFVKTQDAWSHKGGLGARSGQAPHSRLAKSLVVNSGGCNRASPEAESNGLPQCDPDPRPVKLNCPGGRGHMPPRPLKRINHITGNGKEGLYRLLRWCGKANTGLAKRCQRAGDRVRQGIYRHPRSAALGTYSVSPTGPVPPMTPLHRFRRRREVRARDSGQHRDYQRIKSLSRIAWVKYAIAVRR
jgi:hypothetical protein